MNAVGIIMLQIICLNINSVVPVKCFAIIVCGEDRNKLMVTTILKEGINEQSKVCYRCCTDRFYRIQYCTFNFHLKSHAIFTFSFLKHFIYMQSQFYIFQFSVFLLFVYYILNIITILKLLLVYTFVQTIRTPE